MSTERKDGLYRILENVLLSALKRQSNSERCRTYLVHQIGTKKASGKGECWLALKNKIHYSNCDIVNNFKRLLTPLEGHYDYEENTSALKSCRTQDRSHQMQEGRHKHGFSLINAAAGMAKNLAVISVITVMIVFLRKMIWAKS